VGDLQDSVKDKSGILLKARVMRDTLTCSDQDFQLLPKVMGVAWSLLGKWSDSTANEDSESSVIVRRHQRARS
jgi:hypothetical protein